jgi:hypothetical protein
VLYCKYQPSKKLRKNKSFADGILEVAVDTKRAVRALWVLRPPGRVAGFVGAAPTWQWWQRMLGSACMPP